MKLRVNPNRMVLLTLKKRLTVATRGHKLLKDKLDGMIKEFVSLIKDFKEKTKNLDEEFLKLEKLIILSYSQLGKERFDLLTKKRLEISLTYEKKNIMGVNVPQFKIKSISEIFNYPYTLSNFEFDLANQVFKNFIEKLIEYINIYKTLEELAKDIERTRRRVNALEYILIPSLNETIKFIKMRLDELERETHGRLTRIKEIIRGEAER
ncbi:MAG: V-type ATP synthase subunit D [Caldisericia bacterium]|nr:V-type ATP synthase subunit D [Caldisericia bacterium]